MGDVDAGEVELLPELHEQVEHLGPHAHVECGDRLVGHHEVRVGDERTGQHRPLLLPAAQVLGVDVEVPVGRREAAALEHLGHPAAGLPRRST